MRRRWFRAGRPEGSEEGVAGFLAEFGLPFLGETFFVFAIALVALVLIVFFLSLLFLVVEAIVLAAAALLLGRPWTIEAVTDGPPPERLERRVRGWRASQRAVEEVAAQLRGGLAATPRGGEAG